MSVLAAKANGNWTASATWGLVDSTSYSNSEAASTSTTTSPVSSSAFTPGAITIDGIGVKLNGASAIAGTFSVDLAQAGLQVAGTAVQVNTSDLNAPAGSGDWNGWAFFKFAAPVTLVAATAYTLRVSSSVAGGVVVYRDGTANNWSRYLRTTTNQAPVAGDDTIITGEWTAAATMTARTVTQNNNDATAYGSNTTSAVTPALAICKGGSLVWSVAASTNLRLKGHAIVYNGGTYTQGGVGTEIPRGFTSFLEFQCTADGDFGFLARNGSAVNINGLSRTVAKNVVNTLLTADVVNPNLFSSANTVQVSSNAASSLKSTKPTAFAPMGANTLADSAVNGTHYVAWNPIASITNTVQTYAMYVGRGTGTNNRYMRFLVCAGNNSTTSGIYLDVDMQAGTIVSGAQGTGVVSSSSITPVGSDFLLVLTGKISTSAATPFFLPMMCNSLGGTSYAGDGTQCFYYYGMAAYTASSVPNTTALTVADDTGWKSGDYIGFASTSQQPLECEGMVLGSDAGASSLTLSNNLLYAHSGTSPTQAEVILLTRNCGIRGVAFSAVPFVAIAGNTANVTLNWAEFYNIGNTVAGLRAIEVQTTTGSFTANYCSIHDTKSNGIFLSNGSVNNITVTYAMMFNINTAGAAANAITIPATTGTANSLDHCIVMPVNVVTAGINIADLGTSVTNCTVCGVVTNDGFFFGEVAIQTGTFSGNSAHSNSGRGAQSTAGLQVHSNMSAWRNGLGGLRTTSCSELTINTANFFGNTTQSINMAALMGLMELNDVTSNGDTTFPTTAAILFSAGSATAELRMNRCNFGTASGIKTAHTQDLFVAGIAFLRAFLNNSTLASPSQLVGQASMHPGSFIAAERLGGVAATHKTWKPNGTISYDSTIFGALTPSERLTPLSASAKLESGGKIIPLANGTTPTVTAKVRKSVIGDGAAYNGNQPRLVVKANPSLGLNVDTVLATASGAAGSFETLTATLPAPTDDGAFQVVVDCDGTTGWVNDDDWSVAA